RFVLETPADADAGVARADLGRRHEDGAARLRRSRARRLEEVPEEPAGDGAEADPADDDADRLERAPAVPLVGGRLRRGAEGAHVAGAVGFGARDLAA